MAEKSETEATVLREDRGAVALLTLNRPQALNAMTREMMTRLRQMLDALHTDRSVRAVVLTGAGRGFCAGQDLAIGEPLAGSAVRELIEECYLPVFQRLRNLRQPVIVAVNGVAAGGGCGLALAGDISFAAESASFIQVFSRIGLAPDMGSTYFLPRLIGRQRALAMMMSNDPVPAAQAADWGLIYQAVPDAELLATVLDYASRLAAGPTLALSLTRRLVDQGMAHSFEEQFRYEAAVQMEALASDDATEAISAFNEKRQANFRGC